MSKESMRCEVCGHFHPLIKVCPYIRSEETIVERSERGTVRRIVRRRYFRRDHLTEAAFASLDEAEREIES